MEKRSRECRFYEKTLPDVNDLVVVQIKEITDVSVLAELLEYNRQEGMIIRQDYTRNFPNAGRMKLSKRKQDVCSVIRIDKEKKFIDLSRKAVDAERKAEVEQKFEKSKKLQTLLYPICDVLNVELEEIYKTVVWPLMREFDEEHPYDMFQKAYSDFDGVFGSLKLSEQMVKCLKDEIKKKMIPQVVKLQVLLEIVCMTEDAITDLKKALTLCLEENTAEVPVTVKVISPPAYLLEAQNVNKDKAQQGVKRCLKKVEDFMKGKGTFKYKDYNDQKDIAEMQSQKVSEGDVEEDNDEGMGEQDLDDE